MVCLEDIMDFMRKDKEERALEREKDKQEIRNMIIDGVKEEVKKAIAPIKDRQDSLEEAQAGMRDQFTDLLDQVKVLTTKLSAPSGTAPSSWPAPLGPYSGQSHTGARVEDYQDIDTEIAEIIDHARRTIGLYKIDAADLARMREARYGGPTTEDEEKALAVKEYLVYELKIGEDDVNDMEIENIFVPAKDMDHPQSLNVTFKQYSSVSKIYEQTRIMRRESRINNYFPRQFKDRLRTKSEFDYNLRQDKRLQTRIKMGVMDLELHRKLRGTSRWERVNLPDNLPPVDLSSRPATQTPTSPPPGRPGQNSIKVNRENDKTSDDVESAVETAVETTVETAKLAVRNQI